MMPKNLRIVVAQVARVRKSVALRRNFCSSPNPTTVSKDPGDSIALRVGHGLLFGAGFFVAGPLSFGDPVAEVEQTRQQSAKLVCGESAVIGDMSERMWTDLRGRIWSFVAAAKSQSC